MLVTIASILLLYVVGLVIARRADVDDKEKVPCCFVIYSSNRMSLSKYIEVWKVFHTKVIIPSVWSKHSILNGGDLSLNREESSFNEGESSLNGGNYHLMEEKHHLMEGNCHLKVFQSIKITWSWTIFSKDYFQVGGHHLLIYPMMRWKRTTKIGFTWEKRYKKLTHAEKYCTLLCKCTIFVAVYTKSILLLNQSKFKNNGLLIRIKLSIIKWLIL